MFENCDDLLMLIVAAGFLAAITLWSIWPIVIIVIVLYIVARFSV